MFKMHAEAQLCLNVFCGFILLVIVNCCTEYKIQLLNNIGLVPSMIVLGLLGLSALHSFIVYLRRQDRLHRIHIGTPSREAGAVAETVNSRLEV